MGVRGYYSDLSGKRSGPSIASPLQGSCWTAPSALTARPSRTQSPRSRPERKLSTRTTSSRSRNSRGSAPSPWTTSRRTPSYSILLSTGRCSSPGAQLRPSTTRDPRRHHECDNVRSSLLITASSPRRPLRIARSRQGPSPGLWACWHGRRGTCRSLPIVRRSAHRRP